MKTIKQLLEVYKPKSPDEQKFVDKHVTIKHNDRNGNGDDVFKGNTKYNKRKEDRHGYDATEDEKVYEEVEDIEEMSYAAASKRAEASRQRAIKRAAAAYKNHGDMDRAIRDHDLFAKDAAKIKAHLGEELEVFDEEFEALEEVEEVDERFGDGDERYHRRPEPKPAEKEPKTKLGQFLKKRKEKAAKASIDKLAAEYANRQRRHVTHRESVELDEEFEALEEAVELLDEGKVGYKHYTITSGPKMSGMGEGNPDHIEGASKKLKNLDIEHKQGDDYGTTRRVTVTNNQTGESTHHHVYQREWGHNQAKPLISVRHVGKPKAAHDAHHNVLKHYLSGKTKIKEDVDLAFFEDLLEMNLDEDTFTDASLANLRVMRHKQMMKDLEKASKIHPLMKVRRMSDAKKKLAELEKARDHYVAKHEKAQSKKKKVAEEVELDEKKLTPAEMKKREEIAKAMERENPGMPMAKKMAIATAQAKKVAEEVEELDELSKSTIGSYAKKAMKDAPEKDRLGKAYSDLAADDAKRGDREGASYYGKRAAQSYTKAANRRAGVEKAIDKLTKEEYEELDESAKIAAHLIKRYGDNVRKSHVRSAANDFGVGYVALSHAVRKKLGVNRLEEEQIDELSKDTLARYAGRAMNDVRNANQAKIRWQQKDGAKDYHLQNPKTGSYEKRTAKEMEDEHSRVARNREKGVRTAIKKLAKEEVEELDELSKKTLGSYAYKATNQVGEKGLTAGLKIQNNEPAGKELKTMGRRQRGVAMALKKLTKEDIINRAIENYMPEDYEAPSLEDRFLDKIEHLPEAHAVTLFALFDSLNEENQMTMIESADTQEGINALLDFAINSRGE